MCTDEQVRAMSGKVELSVLEISGIYCGTHGMSTNATTPPLRPLGCPTLQAGLVSVAKESPSSKSQVLESFQRPPVCT